MHTASIAIFKNSATYKETSQPTVPDELFTVAQRVIEQKGCELFKAKDGVYVVRYSETGPFPQSLGKEWMPVHIIRLEQWSSGGIKCSEYKEFFGETEVFSVAPASKNGDHIG